MTDTDFDWQYDEQSGLVVATIDDGGQYLHLTVEDDIHPYVEVWVWTRYQGWDHIETYELGDQPNLEASKRALTDWYDGAVTLW